MIRRGALVLVSSLLLGACGESNPEPTASISGRAGLAELTGPYQSEPFQEFDPALVTLLSDACLSSLAGRVQLGPALVPVLIDVRGGGYFMLMMAAPNSSVECIGHVDASGAASIIRGDDDAGSGAAIVGPREVSRVGRGSRNRPPEWSYIEGNAGSEIGDVVLVLRDGTRITASLGGGQFAAWWPSDQRAVRIQAYDRDNALVSDNRDAR